MSSSMSIWRVGRGICGNCSVNKYSQCSYFSCVPEEGAKDSGLVVNDTPAGSTMEDGVEESVEMKEDEGVEGVTAVADVKEEVNKKKGPSNMVSGWGKGAKVL